MMNVLRYTEVHQVNVEQMGFLIELLNEMTEAGGTVAKMATDTKVLLNLIYIYIYIYILFSRYIYYHGIFCNPNSIMHSFTGY